MNRQEVTALTLLDLSAAFDTIDHGILFKILKEWSGVTGLALKWIQSYLADHCQLVQLDNVKSSSTILRFGVPQGSVLGPVLFAMYTTPLSCIIDEHNILHHLYADDTQLYVGLN